MSDDEGSPEPVHEETIAQKKRRLMSEIKKHVSEFSKSFAGALDVTVEMVCDAVEEDSVGNQSGTVSLRMRTSSSSSGAMGSGPAKKKAKIDKPKRAPSAYNVFVKSVCHCAW